MSSRIIATQILYQSPCSIKKSYSNFVARVPEKPKVVDHHSAKVKAYKSIAKKLIYYCSRVNFHIQNMLS